MVLGYSNFIEFNEHQRSEYRASLQGVSVQRLRQLEHEKTVARISSGFSIVSGALASVPTSCFSLGWSAVGWRKYHVANRKLEMIRVELIRKGEALHEADVKDFLLAGCALAVGTIFGAGIVDVGVAHWGGGSSAAVGAVAGGDIASSAAQGGVQQASEALHGDTSVQDGFKEGKKLVPAMQTELTSIIKDPAGPGLSYLATDAGQHNMANLGAASVGSTGAFVSEQVIGEAFSEGLLKLYSNTFEADKCATSVSAKATSPRKSHVTHAAMLLSKMGILCVRGFLQQLQGFLEFEQVC